MITAKALGLGVVVTFLGWAVAAAAIGAWSGALPSAIEAGAAFGFPLALVFALLTYTGADRAGQLMNDVLAGIVGATACAIIAWIAAFSARLVLQKR